MLAVGLPHPGEQEHGDLIALYHRFEENSYICPFGEVHHYLRLKLLLPLHPLLPVVDSSYRVYRARQRKSLVWLSLRNLPQFSIIDLEQSPLGNAKFLPLFFHVKLHE
jgi:hypothetical protein